MDTTEPTPKHFVCNECGTASKNAGTCQADDCIVQGGNLKECHCEDGKHDGVVNAWDAAEDSTSDTSSENKSTTTLDLDSENANL